MKHFLIFGNPVSHSKSPIMHNSAFKALGYDGCYGRYRLKNGQELRDKFFELGIKGANITVPHKEYAYQACDELDEFAQKVGAVNTIVRRDDKLHGYNTDAPGFLKAMESLNIEGRRVLFLGAGGTAQSTAVILSERGYDVAVSNRSAGRLEYFKERGFETFTYDEFEKGKSFDFVVNMTSAGLKDDSLPAPKEMLRSVIVDAKACIDVVYGVQTPFLKMAKEYKKPTKDGIDMLLYQGVLAFDHFTDYIYEYENIIEPMKRGLLLSNLD